MKNLIKIFGLSLIIGMIFSGCNTAASENPETDNQNKIIGPVSAEGRLAVEAVEGGIKVTVKLLDEDINNIFGHNIKTCTAHVEDSASKICIDFRKKYYQAFNNKTKAELEQIREISEIFPFVEKDKNYTFALHLNIHDIISGPLIDYKFEEAGCSAANDGLSLSEYFDFDYAPEKISLYADNNACLHMTKDVTKFFKTNDVTDIALKGNVIKGPVDWSDSEWLENIYSKIKYNEGIYYMWGLDIDYASLISANGANINEDLFKTVYKTSFDDKYWGIDGILYFIFKDKEYSMTQFQLKNADMDAINWGKLLKTYTTDDSTKFKALPESVGVNPLKNVSTLTMKTNTTVTLSESNNTLKINWGIYEGIITWNTIEKKLYARITKVNDKTYEESLVGADFENYLKNYRLYSSIQEFDYEISGNTFNLSNSKIDSDNFENLLFTIWADGFELKETDYSIYCGNRLLEVTIGTTYKPYIIFGISDYKFIVCEYNSTDKYLYPKFTLPFSFNNITKELTIEYEGQSYVLNYKANTANSMSFTF